MLASATVAFAGGFPGSNDNLFRPPVDARKYIDFSSRGLIIDGKPTFITGAEVQYPRIPRALWRNRLLRVRRAGYNTIQTYAYWSFHEPHEGVWDFKGDHDFRAFLDLVHSLGMYAIVRVGPYVNAEWDTGGMPIWLRFKPGVIVRKPNAPFEVAVDEWFDKIIPLVASEQVTHGGPVIMIQLENEHPDGAGTDLPNDYFRHLQQKALSLGIDVPYFFSGLNHGSDPIGDTPIDPDKRQSPWLSTEFWTGWIATYGVDPGRSASLTRATWKVLALGGTGFSQYTLTGGTDFDHWACDAQASAYDFGAPIGQQGDFRIDYYPLKRAVMFADSFSDILASSRNATPDYANASAGAFAPIYARASDRGTICFFDAGGSDHATAQLRLKDGTLIPKAGAIHLDAGEIAPFVLDRPLTADITMRYAAVRLLGVAQCGHTTTVVGYGNTGDPAELLFDMTDGKHVTEWPVTASIGKDLAEFDTEQGADHLRVLLMPQSIADHTWFVDGRSGQLVVIGPDYVGDLSPDGKTAGTEYNASDPSIPSSITILGDIASGTKGDSVYTEAPGTTRLAAIVPKIGPWRCAPGSTEASPTYDDTRWRLTDMPEQMGADGDSSDYCWYRATIESQGGSFGLNFSDAGDWLSVFVNGKFAGETSVVTRYDSPEPRGVTVNLKAGQNQIAVLAAHYGRNKLYPWYGPINDIDAKGIRGTVTLSAQPTSSTPITTWQWLMDDKGEADAAAMATADPHGGGWQNASIGQDVFNGHIGYAWFRTTLPSDNYGAGAHRVLHFTAVDDNAFVYLNGKKLASNYGYNVPFDVDLTSAWKTDSPNELAVVDQNTAQGGGLTGPVTLLVLATPSTPPITGWRMHGNIDIPTATEWSPVPSANLPEGPEFYQATFTVAPAFIHGRRTALRISTKVLSRGFVWLNGHNLGRYPEKSPVDGIYLPECWLNPGKNTVMIFDEDGKVPAPDPIFEEAAASRFLVDYHR